MNNIITNKNCLVVTTTLSNNKISQLRKSNLINNFDKYMLNIHFIEGIEYKKWKAKEQFNSTLKMLETFQEDNYEYGIICQDDFYPINNFLSELNKTIELLPIDWECLHLCPGFLWGRKFRDKSKIGHLNPEYNINMLEYDKSERFFINCNAGRYKKLRGWLGGPVAMIINKNSITKFINNYKKKVDHDDRCLVRILNNKTFICREPQLGYEEECGGTSNNN